MSKSITVSSIDWVDVYVRDGWKKQYEQFLLQREETKKLKRYDEYSSKKGPHHLAAVGKTIGITKVQVATIEHEQLGAPMPASLVPDHIPQFPTPGRAINKLPKDRDKRRMLERLYPEYVFLCSFAHGLPDANLFKMMFNKDSKFRNYWSDAELKDSLLSIAQSAAELTTLYPNDMELASAVTRAWNELAAVARSDRRPLGGVSQFLSQFGFWAEPLARKPLIRKTRRDVRVVEGARLENDSLRAQ